MIDLKHIFDNYSVSQNFNEMKWLAEKVEGIIKWNTERNIPSIVLEIGTAAGGSLKVWEELLKNFGKKDSILIGIDIGNTITWNTSESPIQIEIIIGSSHDVSTLRKVKKVLSKRKIDFIFIDALHTPSAAKTDYILYSDLVKKGGIVGFHDIWDIKPFLDSLKDKLYMMQDFPNGIGTACYEV